MTETEYVAAMLYLQAIGITCPYGVPPGSSPGGIDPILNKEHWEAWEWRPPEHLRSLPDDSSPDPQATPNGEWGKGSVIPEWPDGVRAHACTDWDDACRNRIPRRMERNLFSMQYGFVDVMGTLQLKLPNETDCAGTTKPLTRFCSLSGPKAMSGVCERRA